MNVGQRGETSRELAAGTRLDQYRLLDLVARGGMASIFKAEDTESGSVLAIKVPHCEYENDSVYCERFRREEELGFRLSHPSLVKVLKPREKSRPYIAMEYVQGDSLRVVIDRERPMSSERAVSIARQLCEALAYLHDRGVVHRDLKPDNVIVTANGDLRVLDLGVAQDRSARQITWGLETMTFGTPDYMAPERIVGRRGDERADIYSLGVILYEMLTGHIPHESHNPYILMYGRTTEDPPSPRRHQPGIEPGMEAIVLRALERATDKRYASVAALTMDLVNPASASRTEEPASRAREAPRRRWVVLLLALATMTGLGSLVMLSHHYSDITGTATVLSRERSKP